MATTTQTQPVLVAGRWQDSDCSSTFHATNPNTGQPLDDSYPVSTWGECERALNAAAEAFAVMRGLPSDRIARFLENYAERIDARAEEIAACAHLETALPVSPRLQDVELPRTTGQLRQAAAAAREGSWRQATIDTGANIRSCLAPIGPVAVFGPNNFPLAFNSIAGGDFAAAIAAGNPVIAKANTSHPGTTRLLAEEAAQAIEAAELPMGTVQLLYRLSHKDGERLVADPRIGGTGYTGSQSAGLKLKAAADAAGKPIYLELSSINPVVLLPGALQERGPQIAEEFTTSCLMGTGQFCTNPGLVLLLAGSDTEAWIADVVNRFNAAPVGTLLSAGVQRSLLAAIESLEQAGAQHVMSPSAPEEDRFCVANTALWATAQQFLAKPEQMQTEAFGNASLLVVARDVDEAEQVLACLEGNLTGAVYSSTTDTDNDAYSQLEPVLRQRVGRLLNDKMPTGVAVSPAMNHGGPYPATGSAQFTAVGIPAALPRFSALHCYDNVRPHRLPPLLQDTNPTGQTWRSIDGEWTQRDVAAK
ncbi:MAG: aldehyde dehydrogenase (NADP(+)) [Planctomycetota bacterium]